MKDMVFFLALARRDRWRLALGAGLAAASALAGLALMSLAGWVAASMCVPGIAPPVVWNGDLLADGAVVNSLPVDIMRGLGRGPLIASDVGSADELRLPGIKGLVTDALIKARGNQRPSLTDILFRMTTLTSDLKLADNLASADLFLRMPVEDVGM
ncbi:MAG: hypothetical protein JJU18_06020, partial [Oceanicaulis sp.]|nr:hypothetical protein [Oceanicaulis sp.]